MASIFIGLNRGQQGMQSSDFTVGAATGATDFEVRIDTGKSLTREEVALMLDAVERVVANVGGVDGLLLDNFAAVV